MDFFLLGDSINKAPVSLILALFQSSASLSQSQLQA